MDDRGPTWAIVLAAGTASRYGRDKVAERLGGVPVLDWAVASMAASADGVVVVLPGDDELLGEPLRWARATVTAGASTRSGSVRCGLSAVPSCRRVLVHDAARPLASPELARRALAALSTDVAGVAPALPVRDALKRVSGGRVVASVDRSELAAVQTPQAFATDVLRLAHAEGGEGFDDLELVERAGHRAAVVDGEEQAHKLTVPADLEVLRSHLDRLEGWRPEERPASSQWVDR